MDGEHLIHWGKDWRTAEHVFGQTVVNLPCRRCIGCNQASAREWAIRAFHEAQLHTQHWTDDSTGITTEIPNSSVLTLTYNDDHLPRDGCLDHSHLQKFLKRLRTRRGRAHRAAGRPGPAPKIRYFCCGEYGGKTHRPHYHIVIFGESFDDRYPQDAKNFGSFEVDELWRSRLSPKSTPTNIGRATVDTFTFAGASYVAGYVAKKTQGSHQGPTQISRDSSGTIRITPIQPEYRKMSTHPGIGAEWILKPENLASVYSEDVVKIGEWQFHPPKYYDKLLEEKRPDLVGDIIANRHDGMSKQAEEWSPDRCASAELIALADLQLRRDSL